MISLIWGQDENGLIGKDNRLPWHLPADMAWFRKQTMGKPILMGRKTYDSIGRPLPGRTNIVITKQDIQIEGCSVVHSIDEAVRIVDDLGPEMDELMVMGGAKIYRQFLPEADRLYITDIHHGFEGDAWFPPFDRSLWLETFREDHPADEKNKYPYSFVIMERV
ncbi:MAG: type 3 dihydrofolate reductase [Mariprofundaceae bacterium]